MEFTQLVMAEDGTITAEEKKFVNLHKEIEYAGANAALYTVSMAEKLKEMRDSKLYEHAGFSTFAEYTETAIGIKERQAYNFISVAENLTKDFLQSNARIGITKLALLAGAPAEDREEIAENTDLGSVSVRELKEEILRLKNERYDLQQKFDSSALLKDMKNTEKLRKKAETEAEKLRAEKGALLEEQRKLAEEMEKLKNKPPETLTVTDVETERKLNAVEVELSIKNAEIEKLNKKLELAADEKMTDFKYKFNALQFAADEMQNVLFELDDEKKKKAIVAIKAFLATFSKCFSGEE